MRDWCLSGDEGGDAALLLSICPPSHVASSPLKFETIAALSSAGLELEVEVELLSRKGSLSCANASARVRLSVVIEAVYTEEQKA